MRMRAPKEGPCDPIPPLELPHSLHAFHRVSESDEFNMVRHYISYYFFNILLNLVHGQFGNLKRKDTFIYCFLP